jgi:D-alanine-D-alanine ligase
VRRRHNRVSRLRVAVLMGGRSSEHDVSVASARSVLEGLTEAGYEPVPIEISREGRWELAPAGPDALFSSFDVVFPALHGPFGEDGTVQGLLELADVAYVGAGVASSALAMDKDLFKAVMRDKGVPVPRSATLWAGHAGDADSPYGFPVVVKPARLGSSVGITIARAPHELVAGIELAFAHDDKILLEEFVAGVEVECSVLGADEPVASVPGEIVPLLSDWYDYASKYEDGGMELVVPARISDEAAARVRELAVASFVASDCEGMARVDFFVREDGEVLVNELNTIPGFTATSVYAKLFEASGISYPEILRRLVELALERRERRRRLRY